MSWDFNFLTPHIFPNTTFIFCAVFISNPTCKGEGRGYLQTKAAAQDRRQIGTPRFER